LPGHSVGLHHLCRGHLTGPGMSNHVK
jgi:hypothetical protein